MRRASALWRRRSRSVPSLSARTKCPASSDSVCEHRDSRAGGARVIPTFSGRGRDQPAKRAGGRQAAEAGRHRAQRARIGGNAHAHLQAPRAHRGHAVADAVEHASSARTAMEITTTDVSITLSEVSNALSTSTKARACTQQAPSVEVGLVPVRRAAHKKWGSLPSTGTVHCGHGAAYFFRQPSKARRTKMNGQSPIQRAREQPRRGAQGQAKWPRNEPA